MMLQWCPRENSSNLQSDTFLVDKSSSRILALQRMYTKLQAKKSSFMKASELGKGGGVREHWLHPEWHGMLQAMHIRSAG
jgi:hypothetical protein